MKSLLLGSATSLMIVGFAFAQSPGTAGQPGPAGTLGQPVAPGTPMQPMRPATAPPAGTVGNPTGSSAVTPSAPAGKAAASGNSNQAVATTSANADQPAKGANSFTAGEARRRVEARGFSNVTALTKDKDGIWRGKAQKDGRPTSIWLDYKGNIGQQS